MSWGLKIFIVYTSFALMVLAFVFTASLKKVNLVEDNYYQKEIEYQAQIEKINNANELGENFKLHFDSARQVIVIAYVTREAMSGGLHFYRPSDSSQDVFIPFKSEPDGLLEIETNALEKGLWVVKASWDAGKKSYYKSIQVEL